MGGNGYNRRWRKDWRSTAPIRYRTVKITAAEILLLNSVFKELVPAPGAGRAIEFVTAVLHLDYGSAAYAANGDLVVRTATNDSVLSGTLNANELLEATADKVAVMIPVSTGIGLDINEALELYCSDGVPTTGDSPITVVVGYRVHSFITY